MADVPTRLLRALAFTEQHLQAAITPEVIAAEAGMSLRTFQRHFRNLTGDSVADYLRGRRLTEASQALIHQPGRLLDIALDHQFQSQEVFTRAFQRMFWQSPGQFRSAGSDYAPQQKLALNAAWLEQKLYGQFAGPEITNWPGQQLVGLITEQPHHGLPQGSEQHEQARVTALLSTALPGLVSQRASSDGSLLFRARFRTPPPGLQTARLVNPHAVHLFSGLCCDTQTAVPPELHVLQVPAGQYALFRHSGPASLIRHTVSFAFSVWLPGSGYLFNPAAPVLTLHPLNATASEPAGFTLAMPICQIQRVLYW